VYAGTLYKRIRNPEYLLRLIANLNNEDIVLHLFVQGDCMEIINRYVRGSNGRIVVHGMVSKNEMQSIMQQANILVNLGNSIYEQKPSKLYEYASTGKPIVNVHYQGIEYREFFDRYKLSLNINQTAGNLHNDVINLQRFCVKNANNVLSRAEILESFEDSTPSYIAGIFEHRIKILVESQALEHA
jgi:glycosyltransferase involved in cell wall biosynthesis